MPVTYIVIAGDCIESIAFQYGHFPQTIADDPANAGLLKARGNLHTLVPGDAIVVPDLRPKTVGGATNRIHRFRRRGVPARLKVVLDDPRPAAGTAFKIVIDDAQTIDGTLGDDGCVDVWIDPHASSGTLSVGDRVYTLRLGRLPPVGTFEGVVARLRNLRYLRGPVPADESAENLIRAIADFQKQEQLTVDGAITDALRERLVTVHGS